MNGKIETLAKEILELNDSERRVLYEEVSNLALRKGLDELSKSYTDRLKSEQAATLNKEAMLEQLRASRERIAQQEYGSIINNS